MEAMFNAMKTNEQIRYEMTAYFFELMDENSTAIYTNSQKMMPFSNSEL